MEGEALRFDFHTGDIDCDHFLQSPLKGIIDGQDVPCVPLKHTQKWTLFIRMRNDRGNGTSRMAESAPGRI